MIRRTGAAHRSMVAALVILASAPVRADPVVDAMAAAARIAETAIDMGHGGMCDLAAMPAKGSGYFRCVDIGPYRFVREYAGAGYRTAAYVVAGGEPFRFLEARGDQTVLLFKGPWEEDLLPRAQHYLEDITGTSAARLRMLEPETRRTDAENRLQQFISKGASKEAAKGDAKDQPAQATPAAVPEAATGTRP